MALLPSTSVSQRPLRAAPDKAAACVGAACSPAASSGTFPLPSPQSTVVGTMVASASAALTLRARRRGRSRHAAGARRAQRVAVQLSAAAETAVAEAPADADEPAVVDDRPPRPLQIIKIDLETNKVVIGEEEIQRLQAALKKTGVEKVAVVGVMGAFRTGKSFLLDLMLRYLRETSSRVVGMDEVDQEECKVPEWVTDKGAPMWAVKCGDTIAEGREGMKAGDPDGFLWRPGMEKCTEGMWIWSEAFITKAGDEDVALLLMDTQGAWDARMTKEQSATVFGLTTLMTSRLIYNVSKQIQQDKIDNLVYFTDFAQAALRARRNSVKLCEDGAKVKPFQTLEFLVRDWPHYPEQTSQASGREMMVAHLNQYMDPSVSEDTKSAETLQRMFEEIDVWCLPHPSLRIEKASWDGDLAVIEPQFWSFIDSYVKKIFAPENLSAKTTLGTALTVDTFSDVLREFIYAFKDAAPQAQTFAEAMETSTSLLAKDSALKVLRASMGKEGGADEDAALAPEDFEKLALECLERAQSEFEGKAIFGTEEGIQKTALLVKEQLEEEVTRYREENERKLEASLTGLTSATLGAIAAFGVDRVSDVTCDWWSGFCQELSNDLFLGYAGVFLFIAYSLNGISTQRGELDAAVAALELSKSVTKKGAKLLAEVTEGKGDKAKPEA